MKKKYTSRSNDNEKKYNSRSNDNEKIYISISYFSYHRIPVSFGGGEHQVW